MEFEYGLENFISYKLPEYRVIISEEKTSFTGEAYSLFKIKLEENYFSEVFNEVNKDNSFAIISNKTLVTDGFLNPNGMLELLFPTLARASRS